MHRFIAVSEVPAKGELVTCPWCGNLEIWTREEVQTHGLCRHLPHLEEAVCPVCGERWEGRPEWIPFWHFHSRMETNQDTEAGA